jgi:lysophospholipase L1-like esterase
MRIHKAVLIELIFTFLLVNCSSSPTGQPTETLLNTPSLVPSLTPSQTTTPTATKKAIPTFTPTEVPLTFLFYGDSVLKVGEMNKSGAVGFSIVDILRSYLNPADSIITSNHGGRTAKWGYENLDKNVLIYDPDIVTIWWGMNDLDGCPGIFSRATDKLLQNELDAMINLHVNYMKLQIDALLNKNIVVMVVTPMPILGKLPWSHLGPDNVLVWENNYRCDFNVGLEQLVEAQRKLVGSYEAGQKPVFLVDAWQVYKDHPNSDNMYMDILHPGGYGAKIIADRWLQVFQSIRK